MINEALEYLCIKFRLLLVRFNNLSVKSITSRSKNFVILATERAGMECELDIFFWAQSSIPVSTDLLHAWNYAVLREEHDRISGLIYLLLSMAVWKNKGGLKIGPPYICIEVWRSIHEKARFWD